MLRFFVLLVAGVVFSLPALSACIVNDDTGQTITLTSPAQRLIVLTPDLVENVYAVSAGDAIVGVIKGSDYPRQALKKPVVGSYLGLNLEEILALHPDLIVTWKYAFAKQRQALRQFGVPVYVAEPKQLDDVPKLLRHLGCLTGNEKAAAVAATQFETEVAKLSVTPKQPVSVFIQIDPARLMTVNKDSWINQVIVLCGGNNIYANAKMITPEIDREALLMADPEVIFSISDNDDWKKSYSAWPKMKAVKNKRLYTLHPDWISRAGPRLILGVKEVCSVLTS